LKRAGAEIRLAKDALITPAARDWLKEHAVPVTWVDGEAAKVGGSLAVVMDGSLPEMRAMRAMLDRQGGLGEVIDPAAGAGGLASATRRLCGMIVRKEASKGVVFAADGAVAVCVANKHNGVRAALGTNLPAVEDACRELGANVLVVEYPRQTTYQVRQMIERLRNGATAPRPETAATIAAIEEGGGRADW
jgi:ribose 5-phosphate isomerase RpiB